MRFKMVHAADLHLDSPLTGLVRYEGAPVEEVRGATRRALENLVSLCLEEQARLLLLAGDLYDGDWRDYSTGLFFSAQMERLREAGTQVVWIRGNHDAQSKLTHHLSLGEHCRELSSKRPSTLEFPELELAVHGQGFATPSVTDDLSAGYPEPVRGVLNVGLLHTALSGRRGHAPYAPCDALSLAHRGYDYWALGHVHQRELVCTEPYIVFPGNLQGRHVREEGEKGATLVHVNDGAVARVEHRVLDVVRYQRLDVDVSEASGLNDAAELVKRALARSLEAAGGRLLAARVTLVGRSRAHAELSADRERSEAQVQSHVRGIQGGDVWLESVRVATQIPADLAALAKRDDAVGHVVRAFSALEHDDAALKELGSELSEVLRFVPQEARDADFGVDLDDVESLRELLRAAGQKLLPRLLEEP
jgi:DNA repair exonuclease SbcCD nuclease subunit